MICPIEESALSKLSPESAQWNLFDGVCSMEESAQWNLLGGTCSMKFARWNPYDGTYRRSQCDDHAGGNPYTGFMILSAIVFLVRIACLLDCSYCGKYIQVYHDRHCNLAIDLIFLELVLRSSLLSITVSSPINQFWTIDPLSSIIIGRCWRTPAS